MEFQARISLVGFEFTTHYHQHKTASYEIETF
jgi:hypothetical protein